MKDYRFANRGRPLEEFIRYAASIYERRGEAIVEKIPTEFIPIRNNRGQVCNVKVEHKSTVDFIGRYKQYPLAMEAKNTNSDSIRFDEVQPHQADFMDKFTAQRGTIGLVLVSFTLERFFVIPWAFWGEAYDLRVRRRDKTTSVRVSAFGEQWTIPQKFSARIEDLSPTWEISGRHTVYGLNFLEKAEKFIILE